MAGQTATLLRARARAFVNGAASGSGMYRPAVLGAAGVGIAVIVALGSFAAPRLLEIPDATATPDLGGRPPVVGDAALEAAFWLDALLIAFFAFRVMESLFRSEKVRALELLPVTPTAIFVERLLNAVAEAGLLGLVAGLFFVPLAWHGAPAVGAICAAMGVAATVFTAGVTIGANAWIGANYGGSKGLRDAYGGHGGAFIYAPMVSFALAVVCLFLLQLGAREFLHDGRITNAFWLATGISAAVALGTLLAGARDFVGSYHLVAAFFREADEVGFRAVMDYQESAWKAAHLEGLLPRTARYLFRRHLFQFSRRYPVARTVVLIGAAAGAAGAAFMSPAAFPAWAVALLPAALVTALERPFARLDDAALGELGDETLPLSVGAREVARAVFAAYEMGRVAVPYALAVGIGRGFRAGPAEGVTVSLASLLVAFGVSALVVVARRVGLRAAGAATVISVAGCALMGGALVVTIWAGVAAAAVACVAGAAAVVSWPRRVA